MSTELVPDYRKRREVSQMLSHFYELGLGDIGRAWRDFRGKATREQRIAWLIRKLREERKER